MRLKRSFLQKDLENSPLKTKDDTVNGDVKLWIFLIICIYRIIWHSEEFGS